MPVSNDKNSKPDMGYHGSNMHGYSITEKSNKLDQYAKQKESDSKSQKES